MTGERTTVEGREPIAIVGIGCRFPGGVDSPESFWRLLSAGRTVTGEAPPERVRLDRTARLGGFLEGIDRFDAAFFGISPREAERLDPQQRLLLEVSWEALEDAGLPAEGLQGSPAGVFVGLFLSDYESRLYADPDGIDFHMTTGTARYAASGRLSYVLGLEGPSLTVDTACSSSLVAVHLACRSLWEGECTLALAGGANVILEPPITVAYTRAGMLSPDGRCKFGDAAADGYARSEGAAIVVLKPLSRALADGDPVYALVRGGAVNNDGRGSGELATPAASGQERLLRLAWDDAGVRPEQVRLVEAHGTGTRAGDPVELTALGNALRSGTGSRTKPCLVGSVKTNLGHTEGAAGVAGLIKVALALKHGTVPPSLHVREPNPDVPWDDLAVAIPRSPQPWEDEPGAVAGVSAFGITGTNAHVLLEPFPAAAEERTEEPERVFLLPLSARSDEALAETAAAYASFLTREHGAPLADVCFTAARRRTHHDHRLAVAGSSRDEIAERLATLAATRPAVRSRADERRPDGASGKIVFVFPGQGSQWAGMGRQLVRREPVFREALAACEEAMRPFADWSLAEQLEADPGTSSWRLDEIGVIQPALVALEIALAALWRSWGIEPAAVIGHSMGEVAAAHVAGVLGLDEAMRIICERSRLLRRASGRGAMASVELSAEDARRAIAGHEHLLAVAVSASPRTSVLSGDPEALRSVVAGLEADGVYCRLVKVDVGSHSPQMDPLAPDLRAALAGLCPRAATCPFYSTSLGRPIGGSECDADYWVGNLRRPVLFSDTVGALLRDGLDCFLELSPHPILAPSLEQCVAHACTDASVVTSLRREEPEQETLLASLGTLYTLGHPVDWARLYPRGRCVPLPGYRWQRERYWFEPASAGAVERRQLEGRHPFLGVPFQAATGQVFWDGEVGLERLPYLGDHRVRGGAILPASAFVELALAAAAESRPGELLVEEATFDEALTLGEDSRALEIVAHPDPSGGASLEILARRGDGPQAEWTRHASAVVRSGSESAPAQRHSVPDTCPDEWEEIQAVDLYRSLRARRLQHGPAFRPVVGARRRGAEVVGELELPEGIAEGDYVLHPVLLDGCLQLLLAAVPEPAGAELDTCVPVALERLRLLRRPDPAVALVVHAVASSNPERPGGDVFLVDEAGGLVAEARGVRFRRLGRDPRAALDGLGYTVAWKREDLPPPSSTSEPGTWIVVRDRGSVADRVGALLTDRGELCMTLQPAACEEGVGNVLARIAAGGLAPFRGVVHVAGLDGSGGADRSLAALHEAEENGPLAVLRLLRALAAAGPAPGFRLCLVTRGAQAVGAEPAEPAQALLWGLGRVLASEHPELRCLRVDLDPVLPEGAVEALVDELRSGGADDEVALRTAGRFVSRLEPGLPPPFEPPARTPGPEEAYGLELDAPGLDHLALRRRSRREPGPGEVELKVAATGLNFIDVMKAMGLHPGLDLARSGALGSECAGVITAMGPGVEGLARGDEVIAVTPSFEKEGLAASFVTLPVELVMRQPATLDAEQAAGFPIAFLTAHHAFELARLGAGERVLIHSATGGVGLAAIQLARLRGAEIFATAGTPEKRRALTDMEIEHVFDSRSLAFADEILERTGGAGVDVVLNSLSGAAIERSLAVLAPYGRFLELGKTDIYGGGRIALEPFRKNLSFFAIDIARFVAERPGHVARLLRSLLEQLEHGTLRPLPVHPYPIAAAGDAFREMAQARHTGKLVLTAAPGPIPLAPDPGPVLPIRADGTYLVTGGLGALGLAVAERLAARGATHLALLGRSDPSEDARARIAELEARGVSVLVERADVASPEELGRAFSRIESELPPLAGVVHAAGVLDDGLLLELDADRLRRAAAPKVDGGWNLHVLTREASLDFFVLFSSVAALLGTPGQGNYAAANAFLDALAHLRRAQGLPALSIAWGPWAGIGLAAASAERGDRLAARGLDSLTPAQGLSAFETLLDSDAVHAAVMELDPARWRESHPPAARSSLLAGLVPGPSGGETGSLVEELAAAEPGRPRRALLERRLRESVAAVLRLPPERVPLDRPFKALGLDSLLGLELRNRLEARCGLSLSVTVIWNYPTVTALAERLAEELGFGLDAAPAGEPDDELEDLTTEELDTALALELETARSLLGETP